VIRETHNHNVLNDPILSDKRYSSCWTYWNSSLFNVGVCKSECYSVLSVSFTL